MFRAERPQRGRYRQFFQAGCEIFGDPGPACDAELIAMLHGFLTDLGLEQIEVAVKSLGSAGTRARYRDVLTEYLTPRASELSETSQRRLGDNPLRILDSKSPGDQAIVAGAPSILEILDEPDRAHWDDLCGFLTALEIPFRTEPGLVRGLDYYTRTLFEIRSSAGNLGAQNTLAGGGRYDGMVHDLGGPRVPAIGFALGLERLLLALGDRARDTPPFCFIAPMGPSAMARALTLGAQIRGRGFRADVDGRGGSMKSMLRRANSSGARLCLVIGDSEIERGVVQVKDLAGHSQTEVSQDAVVDTVASALATAPNGGAR
jgi:histidyl-tRNA synthetase